MVRLSTVIGFALAAASVLVPGVLSLDVPACANTCAQQAADVSGCPLTDTNCVCTNEAFQCLNATCSAADKEAATAFFLFLCDAASDPGTTATSPDISPTSHTPTPTDASSVVKTPSPSPSSTSTTTIVFTQLQTCTAFCVVSFCQ